MPQTKEGMNQKRPKLINISVEGNCIGILFVIMTLICLGACSPKHSSYSEYKELTEEGWCKSVGYEFIPQYADSSALYDVKVAFCYTHEYPYRNMSAVVDFIKTDSLVVRKQLDCMLSDANGNRNIPGFGVLYQSEHDLLTDVRVGDFDKIVVWHGLNCDTLKSVTKVGITISPIKTE